MSNLTKLQQKLAEKSEFTAVEYLSLARKVKASDELNLRPLNIAFLSSFTLNLLEAKLVVEGAIKGFAIECYFAPFNHFEQEAIPSDSNLYAFQPDLIALSFGHDDLPILQRLLSSKQKQRTQSISTIKGRLEQLVHAIRNQSQAPLLLWNFPQRKITVSGLAERTSSISETTFIENLNQEISQIAQHHNAVHIFDIQRISAEVGLKSFYDTRLQFLARIPFSAKGQVAIAHGLVRYASAIKSAPKKCLVLDLDNTLWGGIIGEDGMAGIQLGQDYPGSAFVHFQLYLLSLKDRGILLAIASKNNYNDAIEVFEKHPDGVLTLADFADTQINWDDKATSLKKIASNLNIGIDSLVFFDDNPAEREWVRSQLPDVCVLDFPASPDAFPDSIEDSGVFDRLTLTSEDLHRAGFYQAEKKRQEFKGQVDGVEDFLRGLQTKIQLEILSPESSSFARSVQLLERTNQFNLTTRRHSEADLTALLNKGTCALAMRVSDRFGEHGIVGLALAIPEEDDCWRIDTFLLSCRVMGKKIESALLSALIDQITKQGPVKKVIGEYIQSKKNKPVENFYLEHHFSQIDDSGIMRYEFDPNTQVLEHPDIHEVKFI
ncbi:MAG: HAD-IIIC family phosphatase [Verrucomicrobiales bacterium]|nr:HAD-IIIC family phosphatase [Verrucomicrobiales bacterium]